MKKKSRIRFFPLIMMGVFLMLSSSCEKEIEKGTVADIEGNVYQIVKIGSQLWMAENLKTTKYLDGVNIPNVTGNAAWNSLSTPGYCWYNNDDGLTYKKTYGALYNWYTVSTGRLCPTGWHVPSNSEWTTLETYLGGIKVAGGKLKETGTAHWTSPNTGATNESGFTALPGGHRLSLGALFYPIGEIGSWWSTTVLDKDWALNRLMYCNSSRVQRFFITEASGLSVRCIRDY